MEQRPHENPVRVPKGNMQYKGFMPKLQEQEVVNKDKIKLKAHIGLEDDKAFDALVRQVMASMVNNFRPNCSTYCDYFDMWH